MSYHQPTPRAGRRTRSTLLPVVVVVAALVAVLGGRSLSDSSASTASPIAAKQSAHPSRDRIHGDVPGRVPGLLQGQAQEDRPHALGFADGEVPDGVTVFDDDYPAVANLDPALLRALRQAATD